MFQDFSTTFTLAIKDPILNVQVVEEDRIFNKDSSETEEEFLETIALEYKTLKPFLDRYNLTFEVATSDGKKLNLDDLNIPDADWTEVGVLPPVGVLDENWFSVHPWIAFADSTELVNDYPLYYSYSREVRKKFINA